MLRTQPQSQPSASYSLAQLNSLPESAFTEHLCEVYEHSPWVVEGVSQMRPFHSIDCLQAALEGKLFAATFPMQQQLIKAHPDLAAKLEELPKLTSFSQTEQAQAGFSSLGTETLERLQKNLKAYKVKFNHPFILCISDYPATAVLALVKIRMANTYQAEHLASLFQITRIAYHRLAKLIH